MDVISWLDNRTLIACDFMLAIAFAIVFFSMKRSYPILRGIKAGDIYGPMVMGNLVHTSTVLLRRERLFGFH